MPTKPPHHVSSQEFQNPDCHPICRDAIMQNKPNFRPRLCKTNPIPVRVRHPVPQMRKTNPISAPPPLCQPGQHAKNTKRTQFTPPRMRNEPNPHPAHDPNGQNEPNSRTGTACRAPNPRNQPNLHTANIRNEPNLSLAKKRNEPNFPYSPPSPRPPHTALRKTNPISKRPN